MTSALATAEARRRRAPAALVLAAAALSLGALLCPSDASRAWVQVPPRSPKDGALTGCTCEVDLETAPRSSVAMRVRHVTIASPQSDKAKKASPEYEFDEDGGMYDIIKYPMLTEKACRLIEDHNTYTFLVDRRANKPQIRAAIETIFGVKVKKCNTCIPPATYTVKFGRKIGRKSVFKKAMCRLQDGDTIDLFPDDPEQIR